ncbi:DNA-directed RNA polymerase subunit beta' [Catonella massiliensis]|uniref:DNA-directed RNA polymerase subunit beta' n=1 Tax=Catonella massiliensis TaxID=2799636 RepID=A0ABS1IXM6_9FIRM|nr:DNA-directed RNA polymerase subunit beta' [Catonella massiliensis]MBK5896647.1 DNA-directed RNA polymerase subunit beta' [Catonella massiliensis]
MSEMSIENVQPITYDAIKIGLASPEKIKEWSHGEVKKPETINYRTLKPEKDGLYCEKIFGPSKDWECHCGKYKKIRYKGVICDRCGVEVTKATVRRERMGHIELAAPVSHIWYFKGIPSRMGTILSIPPRSLEKVLYFASYIVTDKGSSDLEKKTILSEKEYLEAKEKYGNTFKAEVGAEAIYKLLADIDLEEESKRLKEELKKAGNSKSQKMIKAAKELAVIEAFKESGNRPEWMILKAIPVLPPDLRPMVQLDGGRFATSDMNDLYRRIINRNNRLKKLLEIGAPDIIVRNEKRMLQEAVDALIDNGRRGKPVTGPGNRALKSLSDMLKGKQGRFRQNLLGKRVDYSGRSVIVVGPDLKIYQCGVPKEMAIELFKPFVMKELVARDIAHNIKSAKKMVERVETQVWDVLEDVIKDHPVMLNRAPTLHRLGIQAFEPVLVEGKAIKLHPLVCTAFNADFDGDQMAIHLPLSVEAQAECRFLLLSPNNLLKPSDGGVVAVPSQDMVLGIYYLTLDKPGDKGEGMFFKDMNEALLAYENGYITLQAKIKVRREGINSKGVKEERIIESTLGRFIFNEVLDQNLGFVDRSLDENFLKLEIDFLVKKKELKQILEKCMANLGATRTAEIMDAVKSLGYKYSTIAAMTVSVSDMTVPPEKAEILKEAQKKVEIITRNFRKGLLTEQERYQEVIKNWKKADDEIAAKLMSGLDKYNNIYMMAHSGARGSDKQIKQLAGMRGLMADTKGHTIELPIKSNFREGLDVLEYFVSAHGARKGLSDTALRTADSGYLTRRLVDVSQDLIIRETDCRAGKSEIPGMWVSAFMDGKEEIESLEERIKGRYSCETIYDDNGEVIVKANHIITPKRAARIMKTKAVMEAGTAAKIKIRTVLTCRSHVGICAKCYGANMATGDPVQVGEAVGIIAAQSIGEPGTQLTMRTFHTGGVAGGDITQGLPRVEELFEARKPKGLAIISEIAGKVSIQDTKSRREVVVTADDGEERKYPINYGSRIKVFDGDVIEAGDEITEGSINPHDLLSIKGVRAVQDYMIREVQRVYRLQGVEINDKHIEMIVRQMLKKIKISEPGDTDYLTGEYADIIEFEELNEQLEQEGFEKAEGERTMLGITKASLATNSFLSAASFQETTKVLTDAAIKGKVDKLIGLKENVILGKLIPAGTGMKFYRSVKLDSDHEFDEMGEENLNLNEFDDNYADHYENDEVVTTDNGQDEE